MVQSPSRSEMQDGINDANREPEGEEDLLLDHSQDLPWQALAQAQAMQGGQRAAGCHPLAILEKALLARRASVGLRVCGVEGDVGNGDAEEVGVGGGCLGVDGARVL